MEPGVRASCGSYIGALYRRETFGGKVDPPSVHSLKTAVRRFMSIGMFVMAIQNHSTSHDWLPTAVRCLPVYIRPPPWPESQRSIAPQEKQKCRCRVKLERSPPSLPD